MYSLRKISILLHTLLASHLFAETGVVGWPLPNLSLNKPSSWLGDDPVLGRLICPAVSQYKLSAKQSEGIIFKEVEEQPAFKDKGILWRYQIRSGIYWWNGKPVTSQDLAAFIKDHLEETVAARMAGSVAIPPYEVQILNDGIVELIWHEAPKFGPYIFNGIPFYQANPNAQQGGFSYQCAGIYVPQLAEGGIRLLPAPGYKSAKGPLFFSEEPQKGSSEKYVFKLAENFQPSLADQAVCSTTVDIPWVTGISWNPKLAPTSDPRVRRLFTQLMPRGSLLRQGAGHLGQLASGLIPRSHPGYNKANLIRPFILSETAKALDSLGFTRKVSYEARLGNKGEPFVLRIGSPISGPNLVKKVLKDSFWAVGIKVEFADERYEKSELHGVLNSFMFSWTQPDLLGLFHSKASPGIGWALDNSKLDDLLVAYALTLTHKTPDFDLLPKVHDSLYNEEPISVLMHHKACFSAPKSKVALKTVDDPEWFKDLVAQSG